MVIRILCAAAALVAAAVSAQSPAARAVSYEEAAPIVEQISRDALPDALRRLAPGDRRRAWPGWVLERDRAIRARLTSGDEDSIVNLLLFGVSFTREPRLTERELASGLGQRRDVVNRRIDALIAAAVNPVSSDRLTFVRAVLDASGADVSTPGGQRRARVVLNALVDRYSRDVRTFVNASARGQGLATLFSDRGLSSDTSIYPGFALEQALNALKSAGMMPAVQRVAVIGPGLDFVDKREGLDIYPLQSIQPFALIESLLRLRLADAGSLQVTTFDLSPRVNQHLQAAVMRATREEGYRIELPRVTGIEWTPALVEYWERFGDQIGDAVPPTAIPALAGSVTARAVRVRPALVRLLSPRDLNVVLQRTDPSANGPSPGGPSPDSGQFDIVIATNTLIYYGQFEQSLALMNLAQMLRPGGWLFINDAAPAVASIPLVPVGWTNLTYSSEANSHDRLTWYQRSEPNRRKS